MIAWMMYSALVASIVAAAARAAEWLVRLSGYRVRWIWAGAIVLTTFLSASAALRKGERVALPVAASPMLSGTAAREKQVESWRVAFDAGIARLRRQIDAPLVNAVSLVRGNVTATVDVYAILLSSTISLGVVLILLGVGRRLGRARREWPKEALQGVEVRVAPRIGPVVIGLWHPEIIVPRWLLARDSEEQRLVVTHEAEHVRARDPLLLGVAWVGVVLTPWNVALWYMLSRLRLAVELDCDARVLRRGVAPRSYGTLLIDVAQRASALQLSALALADSSSHLEQRILAMKPSTPRFARLRASIAAAFALTGVLVACQATLPTDAEVEEMDGAGATRAAQQLAKVWQSDTIVYTVDGAKATAAEVSLLPSGVLASVDIVKSQGGQPIRIDIVKHVPSDAVTKKMIALKSSAAWIRKDTLIRTMSATPASGGAFSGLIYIDGTRASQVQLKALDPQRIQSVEVFKGAYAVEHYHELEAAKGVIVITTKLGEKK